MKAVVFPLCTALALATSGLTHGQLLGVPGPFDVTTPGEPIVALPSNNVPGSEAAANAIDDRVFKYLNFDKSNTGFRVTPSRGASVVVGLTLTSANDHPERDPASYLLEGRFLRPENGDECNAAPGFRLVTSDRPETRAVGNTVRVDNLQPDDGRIQIRFFSPDRHSPPLPAEPFRGPGLSGLQLLLRFPPKLFIIRSDQLLLSWPATALNFTLEATATLSPPDWRQVVEEPTFRGDRFEVRLPFSKAQEYFRLRD